MFKKLHISLIYSGLSEIKHKFKSPYAQLVRKFRKNYWSMQAILTRFKRFKGDFYQLAWYGFLSRF